MNDLDHCIHYRCIISMIEHPATNASEPVARLKNKGCDRIVQRGACVGRRFGIDCIPTCFVNCSCWAIVWCHVCKICIIGICRTFIIKHRDCQIATAGKNEWMLQRDADFAHAFIKVNFAFKNQLHF